MPAVTWIEVCVGRLLLPVALVVNPVLVIRCLCPGCDREHLPVAAALSCLVLNLCIPVGLHVGGVPITLGTLACAHALVAVVAWLALRAARRPLLPAGGDLPPALFGCFLLLAVLVFPFTHLAGIDAYKWGDLATTVAVDGRITWLVHPLSLLGFTGRSYPSLHPLVMGSIRTLGATGIESAFFLASLVIGATGLAGAWFLAAALGMERRERLCFTAFYVFSPVFVRYVHWGTGRGMFLAVLPVFIGAVLQLPRRRAWGLAALTGTLLLLSHKTGIIAVVLVPALRLAAAGLPRRRITLLRILLAAALVLSLGFAPHRLAPGAAGRLAGWLYYDLVRFAWMVPAAVAGAVGLPAACLGASASAFMWLACLVILPPAHHSEMYAAMLALPFVTYAAQRSLQAGCARYPRQARKLTGLALTLTLCGALAIVLQRSLNATPGRIHRAACYLEAYDPTGPFIVESPRWRSRIQGIVSGCPRFSVTPRAHAEPAVGSPPPATGNLRELAADWSSYLRGFLSLDTETHWYGNPGRRYVFIADHERRPPGNGTLIYDEEGIMIYRVDLR